MHIYLVRHGQSMGNATNDYSTAQHDQLSPTGWKQAHSLIERLADQVFDAMYVSPLQRAIETISPLAEARQAKIEVWPELAECCWQQEKTPPDREAGWRAAPCHDIERFDPTFFFFREGRPLMPAEPETYAEGLNRVYAAAELLRKRHGGGTERVLMVSHGFFLAQFIELLMGHEPQRRIDHANTGISLLVEKDGLFTIKYINRC